MQQKAFTLIELLVVVLIIGILAAVAVPQYQKAVEKSRATKGLLILKDMTQAQKVYWMENGKFARNTSELSIPQGSCYDDSGIGVYCNASGGKEVHFEWYGTDKTGAYSWGCYAEKTNTFANELCKQYQASWGGTGSTVNGSYTYYKGKSQF